MLNIEYKGTVVNFLVAENNVFPILGDKALDRLGLIKRVLTIAENDREKRGKI